MASRGRSLAASFLIAGIVWSAAAVALGRGQQPTFFVNTTTDMPFDSAHCTAGEPCPLRSAIANADQQMGVVRACYDPTEVGGGPGCPAGSEPLRTSDAGYDPATGRWTFQLTEELGALEVLTGGVTIDFTRDVAGWSGPQDNRIVITGVSPDQQYGVFLESSRNKLAGFELRGHFGIAALDVRLGASNNELGPGLVLAGIEPGIGVRIRDTDSTANRLVGSWCGVTGDGTTVAPVRDDCVRLTLGTSGNTIGGPAPADRNVLAASETGSGVAVDGENGLGTRDNTVQGNWIGADAAGSPAGVAVGVRVSMQAANTRVTGNVIGGNRSDGVLVADIDFGTTIEDNLIGVAPNGDGAAGNAGYGIRVQSGPKRTLIRHNTVAHNRAGGVLLTGATTLNNQVTENRITDNNGHPLSLAQGANGGLETPQVLQVTDTGVIGRSCGGCVIEVFSDPRNEADWFEGRTSADVASGVFVFSKPAASYRHGNVTVTGTDLNGNTTGLSGAKPIPGWPTPTPASTTSPTPTGTASTPAFAVFLPWAERPSG